MKSLKYIYPYILRYKSKVVWGLVFITLSNICSTAIPRFIGSIVNRLTEETGLHGIVLSMAKGSLGYISHETLSLEEWIMRQAGIVILLSIGSGVFLYLTRQTIIVMSRLVEYDLRNDFLSRVQSLPMSYYTSTPTGDIMALATNDISAVREFCGPGIMYAANAVTTFCFAMTMMLTLSPKITLLALIPLPLVSYSVYRIGKKIHGLFTQVQKQFADLTSQAQETLSGVRVVRAYVREEFAISTFKTMSLEYKDKNMALAKTQATMMPMMISLIGLSLLIVLFAGGLEVTAGRASVGDIAQFFAYISQLIWPVIAIGWVTNLIQRGAASMTRLNKTMNMEPERGALVINGRDEPAVGVVNGTVRNVEPFRGKIEFDNVSFRYTPELPLVLKNVSFVIEPGTTLAIVGATGSGKSTIVDLIARLYDVSEGQIRIDDTPISEIPISTLRSSLGIVTQETFLFSDTLEGNIRFGDTDKPFHDVEEASKIAQLYENVIDFPAKFETIVGERGITLSGGQKQRTSIARAIFRSPKILILDDALSAVDTETEEQILSGLRRVMNQRTSIIIGHRISTVKDAHNIIVLHNGTIAERGTHEQLVALNGLYAEMHERQLLESQLAAMK